MCEVPGRVRIVLSLLIALGLSATAAWSWAQIAQPTRTGQAGASEAPIAPVTLTIWNRPIGGKYGVLPVDGRGVQRLAEERPQIAAERTRYTYYPGTQVVPGNAGPRTLNRPYSITADVEIPKVGAEGVLLSAGGVDGGYSSHIEEQGSQ
jgi:hypothetical protein